MKMLLNSVALAIITSAAFVPTTASAGCAYMQGSTVINQCGYTIIGSYKGNDGSWGGYGPISPGGREGTSKSKNAGYRMQWCNYEAWQQNTCKVPHAKDL
ncbi:MAG: hypothetical protein DI628_02000 [Blastochloris viridis]|uniref:Uncharacterized protein n=1 Tax=Blastochloris viridis TaxID=1079 RepID=A0A6N4RE67_BLAVI|nr:MAG: hypothetical protein DI628_02000 [Blastochloris viridis]